MKYLKVACILAILYTMAIFNIHISKQAQIAQLQILPEEAYLAKNINFTITIYISDVINLNVWQVTIKFNPSHLRCNNVTIPPDNIFAGYSIINPTPTIDNENGVIVKFTALDIKQGINGSGKLLEVEFTALALTCLTYIDFTGINQINPVNGTYLQDPNGQLIDFQLSSAQIHILPTPHTFTITKNSETYNITIFTNSTAVNAFNYNETGRQISFNLNGPEDSLSFTCVQIPKKLLNSSYYTVKADQTILPTTVIQNFTQALVCFKFFHGTYETEVSVIGTGPGDLNGDHKVNIKDVALVASAFGSYPGHERWNQIADINRDNKVNIRDIVFVAANYGNTY